MKILTNVTLVNGTNSDDLTVDHLLDAIKSQEAKVETLSKIKAQSKKITAMIKEHEATIAALVKVLDTK